MIWYKRFWMWLKALFSVIDKIEPVIDRVQLLAKQKVANDKNKLQ